MPNRTENRKPKNILLFKTSETIMIEQTTFEKRIEPFENIIKAFDTNYISVSLDWLSVLFTDHNETVTEPTDDDEVIIINKKLQLQYTGKGQEHYKFIFNVLYENEHVATLLSHTRNPKFISKKTIKVDFKNHLLYTNKLWIVYDEIFNALALTYRNISRVDIAIDGLNYLMDFFNEYQRQRKHEKVVEMVGNAILNPSIYNKTECKIESFKIGNSKGKKMLTIYNKSLEITKSRKDYIQEFWLKNNVIKELLPLEILAKVMAGENEKMHLNGYENVYRCELRMKGEIITRIQDFSIELLKDANGLMSILKLELRKFLEIIKLDNERIDRCTRIDLIPYEKFKIKPLERVKLKEKTLLYATQQSISKDVKQLYFGTHSADNASLHEMLVFNIEKFDLRDWFKKRLPKWKKEFVKKGTLKKEKIAEVDDFIFSVLDTVQQKEPQTEIEFELF